MCNYLALMSVYYCDRFLRYTFIQMTWDTQKISWRYMKYQFCSWQPLQYAQGFGQLGQIQSGCHQSASLVRCHEKDNWEDLVYPKINFHLHYKGWKHYKHAMKKGNASCALRQSVLCAHVHKLDCRSTQTGVQSSQQYRLDHIFLTLSKIPNSVQISYFWIFRRGGGGALET